MDEPAAKQDERTLKEETLFSWRAPIRPFKARSSHFFWTTVLIAILLSIIGFVLEGFMVVMLVWAVVFLVFVLSKVPPEEIDYEITTKNIKIAGKKFSLEEASRFWISTRSGHKLLVFEMPLRFPGRLELVLGDVDEDKLKEELGKRIDLEEEPPEFTDRVARWFSKKLSLD